MQRLLMSAAILWLPVSVSVQAATIVTGDGSVSAASGEVGGKVEAGRTNTGTVTIDGGSVVTIESGTSDLELTARPKIDVADVDIGGGNGTVTVTGAGTTVNLNGTNSGSKLEIATFAGNEGTLEVLDGATINLTDDGEINGDGNEHVFIQIGEDEATGILRLDNGTINATGHDLVGLLVGIAGNTDTGGTGLVDMTDSSIVMNNLGSTLDNFVILGGNPQGDGTVLMDNSVLDMNTPEQLAFFQMGREGGTGSLIAENGSTLSVEGVDVITRIARSAESEGTLTLDASTASFEALGNATFEVGNAAGATGEVNVTNGSTLTVSGTSGAVQIGSNISIATEGSGTVNVVGATSSFVSTVGVQIGSALSGANEQEGTVELDDGTLQAPEVVVGTGGFLQGTGVVDATVTEISGGTVNIGSSPGLLQFTGDLQLNSGLLLFEIGGNTPSLFDRIIVDGTLSATDVFGVELRFIDGFLPSASDVFDFIIADVIDESFLTFADVQSDAPFDVVLTDNGLGVRFDPIEPVPLPAGLPLLCLGIGVLGLLKRRVVSKNLCPKVLAV